MNDHDLTQRFHDALDDAAPDPLLWNRVESTVNRKTRNRRFALVAAVAAVPATIAIAAVAVTGNTPIEAPEVVSVDDTPAPSEIAPDTSPEEPENEAPESDGHVLLHRTALAYVDGTELVLVDEVSREITRIEVPDAERIETVAGRRGPEEDTLGIVVRYLDQDGVPELRVDTVTYPRSANDAADITYATGDMFSRFAEATYSAAFDHLGRFVVMSSAPLARDTVGFYIAPGFGHGEGASGFDISLDSGLARLDGFDDAGQAIVSTTRGTLHTIDLDARDVTTWSYEPASSAVMDGGVTRFLFEDEDGEWLLREFPETGEMRDVRLPEGIASVTPDRLRLLRGTFDTTYLVLDDRWVHAYSNGLWRELPNTLAGPITAFVEAPDLPRPTVETPVDRSTWTEAALTQDSRIRHDGVGGVRFGMSLAEAQELTGQEWVIEHDFDGYCYYVTPAGAEHLSFMMTKDDPAAPAETARLQTVWTGLRSEHGIAATEAGIIPGMSREDVEARYDGHPIVEEPRPYFEEAMQLDVHGIGEESELGILFYLDLDGVVDSIKAGTDVRLWMEGCA